MRPAALRLDSFSAAHARSAPLVTAMDVEDAYQRGHEQGLAEGRERSLDALCQALVGCRQELAASRQHETGLRREILAGLVPVLHAIVDQLAPAAQTDRLRQALLAELHRLAEHAPEQQIVLRSPVDMRPELADCLELASFPQARIEDARPGQPLLELISAQGSIVFDPAQVAAALKSLIDDIKTED